MRDDQTAAAPEVDTVGKAQATISQNWTLQFKRFRRKEETWELLSNRFSNTISNIDQIGVNLAASKGRIQDADFAAETSNLAKNQILQQAATAMLAQANASQGSILTLIRN